MANQNRQMWECAARWPLSGFAAHWPKAIHLGGATLTAVVDERANEEQRRALENVVLDKLGGLPFEILATTFSTIQETRFVPFEFHLAGRNSGAQIGNDVAFNLEPVKNPVTGEPEFVRVEHATGFIFSRSRSGLGASITCHSRHN